MFRNEIYDSIQADLSNCDPLSTETCMYNLTFTMSKYLRIKDLHDQIYSMTNHIRLLYEKCHISRYSLVLELTKNLEPHFHSVAYFKLEPYKKKLVINKINNTKKQKQFSKILGFHTCTATENLPLSVNYLLKETFRTYRISDTYPIKHDDLKIAPDNVNWFIKYNDWLQQCPECFKIKADYFKDEILFRSGYNNSYMNLPMSFFDDTNK